MFVALRMKGLIVGRSADPDLQAVINAVITSDDAIVEVLNTITFQLGPRVLLAAKIRMRPGITVDEAVTRINQLETRIKEQAPEVGWCFIEPDCRV